MLGLLDALHFVRQEVYRTYIFKELSWAELLSIEHEIEDRLIARMLYVTLPTKRSLIIRAYIDVATRITEEVIGEEVNRLVGGRGRLNKMVLRPRPPQR